MKNIFRKNAEKYFWEIFIAKSIQKCLKQSEKNHKNSWFFPKFLYWLFNEHFSNVSLITLTADISGANVRLRCLPTLPDTKVKFYKIILLRIVWLILCFFHKSLPMLVLTHRDTKSHEILATNETH